MNHLNDSNKYLDNKKYAAVCNCQFREKDHMQVIAKFNDIMNHFTEKIEDTKHLALVVSNTVVFIHELYNELEGVQYR